jgi:plasmid replication initiation protein
MSHNQMLDKVAKIDNTFIVNAQYRMTAKEQKILYYLISHLDPKNEKDFNTISVPIRQIEEALKESDKEWGGLYSEIDRLCMSLISKNIAFPTNVLVDGKPLRGRINFFSSIKPITDDNGQTLIEFSFSHSMKPFLLQLHHYVNIGVMEIVPMKNAHAIRMYSVFKSEKDRIKSIVNVFDMSYGLEELKTMLGIADKYQSEYFKNFKVNVLDKIKDDINTNVPSMSIDYTYIKTARKVTGVKFSVFDKKETVHVEIQPTEETNQEVEFKNYVPSEKELATLTRAKIKSYQILLEYGIFKGIAYKQILPKIRGSEFEGFEDFFIEKAIQHFEKKSIQNTTKELKASTFVTWWAKNKVFEGGEVWADISEKLAKHKKEIQEKNPVVYENRIIAKAMTNGQFEEYMKNR